MVIKSTIFIIFLSIILFFLLYPFFPSVSYILQSYIRPHHIVPLHSMSTIASNTLYIPSIDIAVPIVEGSGDNTLSKGAWHIPNTGTPLIGNMVIAGHRFQYLPPNNTTFYNLDKLHVGDTIYIEWSDTLYTYSVKRSFVVSPDNSTILAGSSSPTLTLYTCTPLFTANMRLVVTASLQISVQHTTS